VWKGRYYAVYNFSCIKVYERSDDGSHLEPEHVAVNKIDEKYVVTDVMHILVKVYGERLFSCLEQSGNCQRPTTR
jgi:hypothetical protein